MGAGLLGGTVTIAFLFLPGMRAVERRPPEAPAAVAPVERSLDALTSGTGSRAD